MANDITNVTKEILPDQRIDCVAYGCTSGTIAAGYESIKQKINLAKPDAKVTTPITSTIKALKKEDKIFGYDELKKTKSYSNPLVYFIRFHIYPNTKIDGINVSNKQVEIAKETSIKNSSYAGVIVFEPHPRKFFNKNSENFYLSDLKTKEFLLNKLGIECFVVLNFDKTIP